ncbi:hypothetical protein [Robiginitomaculum antarcticum]|uniref:hypothetical protein n=1 Tax=Robiginitomaculum antarcticum TaxID=437507 RepID=UPI0003778A37|nr:hypothetical protein [Robiginitomaculum antarcticum]
MYKKFSILKPNIKLVSNIFLIIIGVVVSMKNEGSLFGIFLAVYGWTLAVDSFSDENQTLDTRYKGQNVDVFLLIGYSLSAILLVLVFAHQVFINMICQNCG